MGAYAKAEPLYLRALAIRERPPASHPDTASSLNSLAALYDSRGDYAKAEPLYCALWQSVKTPSVQTITIPVPA